MNARLLVAEDNAEMRDFLQEVLEDAGYETVVAGNGDEALAYSEREREMIDLIITDVRMPDVKGDELLTAVRERRAEAPVIIITAFGSVEQAVAMVKSGAFQYLTKPFNLHVIHLHVPALRERPFDVPLLIGHFITKSAEASGSPPFNVSPEALAILTTYSWPGNIRELENAIERAVAFARGATLTPDNLPERVRTSGQVSAMIARSGEQSLTLRELEREYIFEMLRRTGGNKKRAAEWLGLDRKTLYRKLDKYRAEGRSPEL